MTTTPALSPARRNRVLGRRPGPHLLIKGYGVDVANRLRDLFPTIDHVTTFDEFALNEYEALLTTDTVEYELRRLHTIVIPKAVPSGQMVAAIYQQSWVRPWVVAYTRSTVATELRVADGLPDALAELVFRELLPVIQPQVRKKTIGGDLWVQSQTGWIEAFALTSDDEILAGQLLDAAAPCWVLPAEIGDPVPWLRCAYDIWSADHPDLFPPRPNWRKREEWQTVEEGNAVAAIRAAGTALVEAEKKAYADGGVAFAALDAATRAADLGVRRLLTAQGDELRDAVTDCLSDLGFAVQVMDHTATKGDLLEDLRVTDASAPAWIALAEVRGYKGGAALNDLLRIGRFVKRFLRETGKEPSRTWYIVNSFFDRDPTDREEPLRSNPKEVATFAADNGAVIDTRVLFRIVQDVAAGRLARDGARAHLRDALGVVAPP